MKIDRRHRHRQKHLGENAKIANMFVHEKNGCTFTSGPSFCFVICYFSFCFVLLFCFVFVCNMKREGALFVVRHQMHLFYFQCQYVENMLFPPK